MGIKDPKSRTPLAIATVPSSTGALTTGGFVVLASSFLDFSVTTFPDSRSLSLWNFLWSVAIDTNDDFHMWPNGPFDANNNNLTQLNSTQQGQILISSHVDWAHSSDQTNIRTEYIHIKNFDTSAHTLYLYYKAYTQPTVGTVAASN